MTSRLPLRVAVVARSVYPLHGYGGLERHVYDLVRSLLKRELRVILIAPPAANRVSPGAELTDGLAPELVRRFSVVSVPYRTFPFANRRGTTVIDRSTAYLLFGLRAGRVAAALAAGNEIDVVHGHGASALGYARARVRVPARAKPFVFNPHGFEEFGSPGAGRSRLKWLGYLPLRRAVRTCANAADRVVATDRILVDSVTRLLGVSSDRIRVVPNGVDIAECDRLAGPEDGRRLRERAGLDPREVLLVSVGRLEYSKGLETLMHALRTLRGDELPSAGAGRAHRPWKIVLVGEGPLRPRLERVIQELGLRDRVTLRGAVDPAELHAWYEAASVFVHPTLYEGSSLVTLEAMVHRRVVVATKAGGIPDKVIPGVNGWLVEPGDAGALAGALGEALRGHERWAEMGAEARGMVERSFSLDAVTDQLLQVYDELV
ncbi:MAG: glycosyltransferase family 4 protein [Gemmatimonadetes bacterium]|nr:glycosyltransferase family 4 protein [Gemmatimonadota bacterium]